MRLQLTQANYNMLAKFLDAEYKKRLMIDRSFSMRSWALEIGVNVSTLSRWMSRQGKDPDLSARNYNALSGYFGQPVLDAMGINPVPAKPRNPLYGK